MISETRFIFGFPNNRPLYSYDVEGRLTGTTYQFWSGSNWIFSFRDTSAYNAIGDQILSAFLTYDDTLMQWDTSSRSITVMTYNANQKPLSETSYFKTFGQTPGEAIIQFLYYYNSGNLTAYVTKSTSINPTILEPLDSIVFVYGGNNQVSQAVFYNYLSNSWIQLERYVFIVFHQWTGDVFTSLIGSYTSEEFNGSSYTTLYNHTSQYLPFGTTVGLDDYVDPLTPDERYWAYYDAQFNFRGNKDEVRINNTWVTTYQDSTYIDYDAQNRIIETIEMFWSETDSMLVNVFRKVFSGNYTPLLTFDDKEIVQSDLTIYPNPATDILHLQSEYKVESLAVFDTYGKQVLKSNNGLPLDVRRLSPGIYYLRVQTEKGVGIKKMVKE